MSATFLGMPPFPEAAVDALNEGDILVIAGKGHEAGQIVGATVLRDLTLAIQAGVVAAAFVFMHRMAQSVDVGPGAPEDEVLRCEECSRILVRTPESGLPG